MAWAAANDADAKDMQAGSKDSIRYLFDGVQGSNSNVFRFQMKNPVLQDERVRRAISMSIDRKTYNETRAELNGGFAKPSISWQALFDKQPTLADDPGIIYFTSGTTGMPKMVLHTQAGYGRGHALTARWLDARPGEVVWNMSDTGWAKAAWS